MQWTGHALRLARGRDDERPDLGDAPGGLPDASACEARGPQDPRDAAGSNPELAEFIAQVDEYAATLTRVASALVGIADAEDATQEALTRAWRAWPALRERAAARAWLINITVNVCRDWLRGRFGTRVRLTQPLESESGEESTFAQLDDDPGASDHASALDLRHAINSLDEDLRLAVVLRYYAGMDSSAIGAALGMPAATVRTRLRRALSLLREHLQGPSGSAGDNSLDPRNTDLDREGRR